MALHCAVVGKYVYFFPKSNQNSDSGRSFQEVMVEYVEVSSNKTVKDAIYVEVSSDKF